MSSMDRRNFFKAFVPTLSADKRSHSDKQCRDKMPETLTLGPLSIFPLNSCTQFSLFEQRYELESLPEGLRFTNLNSKQNLALTLENNGQLVAHLSQVWPANSVLSIMTGEQYTI